MEMVHHDHDNFFRVISEKVNGLFPAAFDYDDDGLLIHAGGMTLKRSSDTGLLDETTLGLVVDEYTRNTHGEVTPYAAKVNGTVIFEVLTPRDALGRIDSRTEITNLPMNTQTTFVDYVYDAAGRLTDANGSQGSTHYDYDANGNRLGRTDGVGTESGVYDDQDRITNYAGRTYAYDLRGSLESVTHGALHSEIKNMDNAEKLAERIDRTVQAVASIAAAMMPIGPSQLTSSLALMFIFGFLGACGLTYGIASTVRKHMRRPQHLKKWAMLTYFLIGFSSGYYCWMSGSEVLPALWWKCYMGCLLGGAWALPSRSALEAIALQRKP